MVAVIALVGEPQPGLGGGQRADADLILLDGNASQNLDLVVDPGTNSVFSMKGGNLYKSTVK